MALTRRQLKEIGLPEETIDRIIAAHAESIAGLKAERDAWREAAAPNAALAEERDALKAQNEALTGWQEKAEALQAELDGRRAQELAKAQRQAGEAALAEALAGCGANPKAIGLLMQAADPEALTADAAGAATLAEQIKAQYAAFFAAPERIPTGRVTPPVGGGAGMQDIERMSIEEINDNWSAVKSVLMMKGE